MLICLLAIVVVNVIFLCFISRPLYSNECPGDYKHLHCIHVRLFSPNECYAHVLYENGKNGSCPHNSGE